MRFTVPQFIEREPRIVGPLTFKQFIYIAAAGAVCLVFYFSAPFYLFIIACLIFGGIAFAFAFLKIGNQELPTILKNFLIFFITPKMFIWKKGKASKVFAPEEMKKEKTEEPTLKIGGKSRLRDLSTKVETKLK